MARESSIVIVTRIAEPWFGAFRGQAAMANGVSRKQLGTLHQHGVIGRLLRDTYRLTAAPRCHEQILSAGLLWAGAFGLYAVHYWPVLTRPRLDGKPG